VVIYERLKKIVVEQLGVKDEEVVPRPPSNILGGIQYLAIKQYP